MNKTGLRRKLLLTAALTLSALIALTPMASASINIRDKSKQKKIRLSSKKIVSKFSTNIRAKMRK